MTEPQSEPPPLNPRTYLPLGDHSSSANLNKVSWIVKAVIATAGCVGCGVVIVILVWLVLFIAFVYISGKAR
jgi:hypothetical protein